MADTVTLGQTNGSPYTWASAGIAWNGITASVKTWAESYDVAFTVQVDGTLAFAEAPSKAPSKAISEAFAISEAGARSIGLEIARALSIAEAHADVASFVRQFDETVAFAELRAADAGKAISEALGASDGNSAAKAVGVAIASSLTIAEARAASFDLNVDRALSVGEAPGLGVGKSLLDAFSMSDSLVKATGKAIDETLAVLETMDRVAVFSRAIAEGFSIAEAVGKAVSLAKSETLDVNDELRRTADAVISDIFVGTGDISEAQFAQLLQQAQAVGYGPFRNFLEGDHEYQHAIFKAAIEALAGSRPRIEALSVSVDVPDLFDSGSATTSASSLVTVNFNRTFYAIPEVNVALKGGTVFAIPRIHNITLTGFDLELVDSTSARVAGNVSWAAKGY